MCSEQQQIGWWQMLISRVEHMQKKLLHLSESRQEHKYLLDEHPFKSATGQERRVTCLSGCIWITVDGELRDIILTPGQSCAFGKHHDVLIAGCPICEVSIVTGTLLAA